MTEQLHPNTLLLLQCVEHWAENYDLAVRGEELSTGRSACPLCLRWNHLSDDTYALDCVGCPIAEYSGEQFCRATPYLRVEAMENRGETGPRVVAAVLEEYQMLVEYTWRHWQENPGEQVDDIKDP